MIIEGLLNLVKMILKGILSIFNLPSLPEGLINSVNGFFDLIFNNLSILGFFIRPVTIQVVVPLLIVLINFKHIYNIAMWLLRKIPFLNID